MNLNAVVRVYYTLTGVFNLSASLIWGVNTLFMLDAGLSIFQVFAANAAFTAGMVIFEIPTGVVADTRGRRLSFLLAIATLFVGTIWYVMLARQDVAFVWWVLSSVLLGLGFTFYSGAVDAWFVDAFNAAGGGDLDPYFARNAQVFGLSMLVGTLGGGFLGSIDLALPFLGRAVLLGILLGVGYFTMKDHGFEPRPFKLSHVPEEVALIARDSWKHGWMQRPVRLLMMISFVQGGFLMWGWYAWQPYFLELLGQDLVWVAGIIAALVGIAMMVGNQLVRYLHGRLRRGTTIVLSATGFSLAMLGVGFAPTFVLAVASFLVGMVFFGLQGPVKQSALHALIPSKQRATIVSFDGLVGSTGGIGMQLGLAELADRRGYAAGYVVGGAIIALAIPIAWLFRAHGKLPEVPPDEAPTPQSG